MRTTYLSRRLIASVALAAFVGAVPGPDFHSAFAQAFTAGSLGAAAGSSAAGSAAAGAAASVRAVPGMDFRLGAPAAIGSLQTGPAPLSAPVAQAAFTPAAQGAVLARPAVAAAAIAPAAVSVKAAAVPTNLSAPTETAVLAVRQAAPAASLVVNPQAARTSAAAAPADDAQARADSAKLFDGQALSGAEPAAVSAVTAPQTKEGLGSRLKRHAVEIFHKIDLSHDPAALPEPPAPPPTTRAGKLVASAQTGLAGVLAATLGAGAVFSGAAVAASVGLWTPAFAVVAGALGLGAAALAVKTRLTSGRLSALPAILGGAGLLLLGAAGAPLLVSAVGLTALRLTSVASMAALALAFEFLNGMHDAANSIATVVATKTLSPRQAILWAAFFNSAAYFFFGSHIAATIGSGLIVPAVMSNMVLVAALLGACLWNWVTVRLGIPVSSSHALIGGLVGAALVAGGLHALMPAMLIKTALFMVLSPVVGLVASFALMAVIHAFFRGPLDAKANRGFAAAQLFSSALLSLGHGGNDSQKTIGIITALMFANGLLGATFHVPVYVALASYAAMGLGTASGGWRIIKTLGEKVTTLDRSMGTAAEVGAGAAIMLSTWLGVPVSTTHVVTGAVTGVGAAHNGVASVKWGTLAKIAWAWVLTIPVAALVSALIYALFLLLL